MAVSSEQLARADDQGAGAGEDWASATADAIEKAVQSVRAKTADPLERVVRLVVYGLLAGVVGIAIAVLFAIGVRPRSHRADRPGLAAGGLARLPDRGRNLCARGPVHLDEENRQERKGLTLTEVRNVVVVGSGPAGLTAAIYTARANLAPLVIEGELSSTTDQPGGQLMLTTEVENYPGFVDGIMGPDLMANFRSQAARFGAEFRTDKVTRVDLSSRPFGLWVGDPSAPEPSFRASSVIVATGAQSLMLGLPDEERLLGHGLSTCATCDGFFFRGQRIGVVGGGDSAIEEAIFLTRFAERVTILHRRDQLRASKIMQERAFKNDKIDFVWNVRVSELVGGSRLEGVVLEDVTTGTRSPLELGGLFVAIGHRPNTDLFREVLDVDDAGYLVTRPESTATNIPGVFACGDVQDHTYRQAITAAGSGCMAAIDAERWLEATGAAPPDIAETPTDW